MKIESLRLPSADLRAVAQYFREVLELAVNESVAVVTVDAGSTRLEFVPGPAPAGASHLAFTIPCNQLAEAKVWLGARVELLSLDGKDHFQLGDPWDSDSIYFRGPDGLVLELIARRRLDNQSSGAFTSSHILSVSEVGLAVPDVQIAEREMGQTFGIPPFAGDSESFQALGDHRGLLILVSENRPWFPTKDAVSLAGYLEVELADTPRSGTVTSSVGWHVTSSGPIAPGPHALQPA